MVGPDAQCTRDPHLRCRLGPCAQCTPPAFTVLARPVCAARGLRLPGQPRPVQPVTAWHSAVHAGAVTALGRTSRRSRRRCHSGRGGANDGGRAPTTVRLPAGHGGGEDSSPELLIDCEEGGEGEIDAPWKRNDERKAQATLTVDETRDGGGRPDSDGIRTRRWRGFRQRRRRGRDGARRGGSDSGGSAVGTGPVGTALRYRDAGARSRQHI
jgi:hypothetical protein